MLYTNELINENVKTTLLILNNLSETDLKNVLKKFFIDGDDKVKDIYVDTLFKCDKKYPRYLKWIETRIKNNINLTPIAVAKEARKRFKLPKCLEPAIYKHALRVKNRLRMQNLRAKRKYSKS